MTEGQLYAYERFWDEVNMAHVLKESSYKEGMEKGMAEGRAEATAKAMQEKSEAVRKMKAKNYPLEDIAEITGLSVEDIEAL